MTIPERLASYRTLTDALRNVPVVRPFVTMWNPRRAPAEESVGFGQFMDLAAAYSARYKQRGVRPGDVVILVIEQSIELLAAFSGALLMGAVPTILAYPTFKIDPAKYRHGLSGVTRTLRARLIVLGKDFPPDLVTLVAGTETLQLGSGLPPERADRSVLPALNPDDVAFIQHSAGTTGLQKGVALSHRSVLNQLVGLARALELRDTDKVISWLPLYHDMGLIACFVLPLVAHLALVMQSPTDWVMWPGSFFQLASAHRCSLCWLPNFAYQFLARRVPKEQRRDLDLSVLRSVINCSEPVRAESMEEFYDAYRPWGLARSALQTSYAMAENTFAVTQSDWEGGFAVLTVDGEVLSQERRVAVVSNDHPSARQMVSSGRCLPGNQIRVVNEVGRDLPVGAVGEIVIQSNSLFGGYYHRPDLTSHVLSEGWYRTGDLGFLWDGEVFVIGRKDDVIIMGGRNFHPEDIEETVSENPSIQDGRVVAFGVFNPSLGTEDLFVVAEVNSDEHLSRSAAIQADIRQRIHAEIGVTPRVVHVVSRGWIVKSTAGKLARSTVRQKLLELHPEFALGQRQ